MLSSRLDLDGTWQLRHARSAGQPLGPPRPVRVPSPWQAELDDLRTRAGFGLYSRTLRLPDGWLQGSVRLHFGAVFHIAEVAVNGIVAGTHVGGFLPFAMEVGHLLRDGEDNLVEVRVEGPVDGLESVPELAFDELPFGKQSWYGPLTGIWQSVRLERRDVDHVRHVAVRAERGTGRVRITTQLARRPPGPLELEVQVDGPDRTVVAAALAGVRPGQDVVELAALVPDARDWSPDRPDLYRVRLALRRHGELVDQVVETFGFRSFEARDGRFWLNGEPFYLRGALDQDYWPDGICAPPSIEALEDQVRKAKELGLNCLRCHIKVPDPRYYDVADRLGMLIWSELPNFGRATPTALTRAEATLRGIIERDGNHPSIVCWTLVNENWGVDLVHDETHRAWLAATFAWLKGHDPGRLVVDNSPLAPSRHLRTDIADYHFYAAHPDHRETWDHFVHQLARRPAWLFGHGPDAAPRGDEPIVCSEFGCWGLPDPALLADAEGREPWWFETGHDWGDGAAYPHGVERRFADLSLDRVFGSLAAFAEAAQWQQFRGLRYQIAALRRHAAIAGYVVTELTDCHWECNGLLDMRRNPRAFHRSFADVNADTVIVPEWRRTSAWGGEVVRLPVAVAHGAGADLAGARLIVRVDGQEAAAVALPAMAAGTVTDAGTVELAMPDVDVAAMVPLELRLERADGAVVTRTGLDFAVHPPVEARCPGVRVWSECPATLRHLEALGHVAVDAPEGAELVVADHADAGTVARVRDGGRLLLLPSSPCRLEPLFPHWQNVRVVDRHETLWTGDWISTFAWQRREGPFARLPGGPLLDEAFDRALPAQLVVGCSLLDFQARVQAGLVLGWIHKPAAITVERAYGRGRFVVSTFRLFRDEPGVDPTAAAILQGLLELATREDQRMQPVNETLPVDAGPVPVGSRPTVDA